MQNKQGVQTDVTIPQIHAGVVKQMHLLKEIFQKVADNAAFNNDDVEMLRNVFNDIDDWLDLLKLVPQTPTYNVRENKDNEEVSIFENNKSNVKFREEFSGGIEVTENRDPLSYEYDNDQLNVQGKELVSVCKIEFEYNDCDQTSESHRNCDVNPPNFIINDVRSINRAIEHENAHNLAKESFECDICGKTCAYKANLIRHLRSHTNERQFKCEICEKAFNRKYSLRRHLDSHVFIPNRHSVQKPYEFKCEHCKREFMEENRLKIHLARSHGKMPFKCEHCKLTFRYRSIMDEHLRVHTGEKPHKCNICGRAFAQRYYIREHLKLHSGKKPYICETCGQAFAQRGSLTKHAKIHSEKKFKCDICGREFPRFWTIKLHMRTHSGEKPFMCEICGRTFSKKDILTTHERIHASGRIDKRRKKILDKK